MAYLGPAELARVALLRPELLAKLRQLMTDAEAALGVKTYIPEYGGLRTVEDQARLVKFRDDTVKAGGTYYAVAPAGHSMHAYGAAFDIKIVGGGSDAQYKRLGQLGEQLGLRWGGHFGESTGHPEKRDPFHFELPETLAHASAEWDALKARRLQAGH